MHTYIQVKIGQRFYSGNKIPYINKQDQSFTISFEIYSEY